MLRSCQFEIDGINPLTQALDCLTQQHSGFAAPFAFNLCFWTDEIAEALMLH